MSKNKQKKHKNIFSKLAALLIGILGLSLLVSLVIISIAQKNSIYSYFTQDTANSSQKIYEAILNLTEENYPEKPEHIVTLYTEPFKLLYGNRIKDEYINSLLPIILEKQRILLSERLLIDNPFEEQIELVKGYISFLQENKLKITSVEISEIIYKQENPNACTINIIIQDNALQDSENLTASNYYYEYLLEKDASEKWRIIGYYLIN